MNSEVSDYIEKFNAFYYPIKDKIGNIGVIVAGFALAALSFFVRTDIFGFLLDFFGVIGILAGIVVVVIGVFMLGIEEGWWNAPAAFNKHPANPAPQRRPTTAQRAEAQSDIQPSETPEPPYQPEYPESQEAGTYQASAQEQYAPASYQPQPQPQQGGFKMPDFLIRMRGNILISALMIWLGGLLLGVVFVIIVGILTVIPFIPLDPFTLQSHVGRLTAISIVANSIPLLGGGILGGITAGNTRKAIYAVLLYVPFAATMTIGCSYFTSDLYPVDFNSLEFWVLFLIVHCVLLGGAVIGSKIMSENYGTASDDGQYPYDEYQGPYR